MMSETIQSKTKTSHSGGVNVTTKSETTRVGEGLELNPTYFMTLPGILKLLELLIAIICMGCASPVITNYARFFMFVVAIYFVFTIVFCFIYFFSVRKMASSIPWLLIELIGNGLGDILYLIAAIVMLAMTTRRDYYYALKFVDYYGAYVAAGVFALFNSVVYSVGFLLLLRDAWTMRRENPSTAPAPAAPNGTT